MKRVLRIRNGEPEFGGAELLDHWTPDSDDILWLDLHDEPSSAERKMLNQQFRIPNLAIDDAQRDRHPPKHEDLGHCQFLIVRGLHPQTDSMDFRTIQIAVFLGKNFLITRHNAQSPSIDKAWAAFEAGELNVGNDPERWAYRVLRNVCDRYTPILLALEERLEVIEEEIIEKPDDKLLGELLGYSRQLKKMRRIMNYHESHFRELLHPEHPRVARKLEFNDILEQTERLASLSNLYHEITGDLINGYLSVSSHRLNKVMQLLTIVTVIFVPLTFIAGIYGMNFDYIPELKVRWGYFAALSVMLIIAVVLIAAFRKRRWI